jgi:hypothetical protein
MAIMVTRSLMGIAAVKCEWSTSPQLSLLCLVAKLSKFWVVGRGVRRRLLAELDSSELCNAPLVLNTGLRRDAKAYLALVEGLGLDLPLLLQAVNDILVAPANLMGQTLQNAEQV